jgi:hypothetical protein
MLISLQPLLQEQHAMHWHAPRHANYTPKPAELTGPTQLLACGHCKPGPQGAFFQLNVAGMCVHIDLAVASTLLQRLLILLSSCSCLPISQLKEQQPAAAAAPLLLLPTLLFKQTLVPCALP